jgi:hypothetical protein
MDTLRDKIKLEEIWESGKRPWAKWERKCESSSQAIWATSAQS